MPSAEPPAPPPRASAECAPREPANSASATAHSTGGSNRPWLDTELGVPPVRRRGSLPHHDKQIPSVNLWSLIRDWIGKDVHKMVLPTHLNEPLTELQRRAEAYQYSELLDAVRAHPWLFGLSALHASGLQEYVVCRARCKRFFLVIPHMHLWWYNADRTSLTGYGAHA